MGRVAAPFGVQGWVKLQPYTAQPLGMVQYAALWVGTGDSFKKVVVEEIAAHGRSVLCKFAGVATREQAAGLKGTEVGVLRSELPESEVDEIYWADLIGMQVINTEGVAFGTIAEMIDNGAQSVMVIKGERERLIPFVPVFVREVSLGGQRVIVEWGADF